VKALLVCAASVDGTIALLPSLAAEADVIVAVDGGGSVCLSADVVPDVVLGDFDSLPAADLDLLTELGASVRGFPTEKDQSDLELAVAEVRELGATSIVVTAASSGRLDHTMSALGVLAAAADLRPQVIEPDLDVWILSSAGRSSLQLLGAGATVSLIPIGVPAVVSAEGMRWDLDRVALDHTTSRGLSNRIASESGARISVSEGAILVFAPVLEGTVRAQAS
jgi:thiamine pyrophosphokinase